MLRRVGDLTADEVATRVLAGLDADAMLDAAARRAARGARCASAASSAGSPPRTPACTATRSASCRRRGLPEAFLADVPDALERLVRALRRARTARSRPASCAARYGVDLTPRAGASSSAPASSCAASCAPAAREREWCDPEVLRRLRRASLAVLRKEIEPADQRALAALPAVAGRASTAIPPAGAGIDRLREVLVPLQGLALPAEVWERDVLPRRVGAYSPAWMDQLCATGEVVWVGAGALGRRSGRVALYFRDDAAALGPPPRAERARPPSPTHELIRERLRRGAVLLHRPAGRGRRSRPRSSRRRCGTSSGRAR